MGHLTHDYDGDEMAKEYDLEYDLVKTIREENLKVKKFLSVLYDSLRKGC